MTVLALVAADTGAVAAQEPDKQETPAAPDATRLPLMHSDPPPERELEQPAGDFSYFPGPSGLSTGGPASGEPSFDPARSTPLDDQTTPTKRVWRNHDGSFTTQVALRPVRHRDAAGRWVDDDLTLVPAAGGELRPRSAPETAAVVGGRADRAVATVSTSAGPVELRHRRAAAVAATTRGATATFPAALPGRADLTVATTADGFKETVTLPDAAAGPSYREELVLPPGAGVRNAADGIEITDSAGARVASYGLGMATTPPTRRPVWRPPLRCRCGWWGPVPRDRPPWPPWTWASTRRGWPTRSANTH